MSDIRGCVHEGPVVCGVALKQDKCRTWKLKCFKHLLLRLSDLERVMKREKEPEKMGG